MSVVIASAARTPIGALQGSLSPLKASRLGAAAIEGAMQRAGVGGDEVDLVMMGCVLQAGMGQAPARQSAIYAGVDESTPAVTVNKMCGSGLETIIGAARAVALGDVRIAVAGGMESMSNAPYLVPGARGGLRMGNGQLIDSMIHDGLWDVYGDKHMGNCAELCAREYSFSRESQDDFAERSYRRAQAASANGAFETEIVNVEVPGRRGAVTTVSVDEGPDSVDFDKMRKLRPAFDGDGTVTAANASTINDGAAAVVITSEEVARERGMKVLARLRGYSSAAGAPERFTTAPLGAMRTLFERSGLASADVGLYEINEAFSVVPMAAIEEFGLDPDRVNVHGGAVALGHPIGASGARIVVTLLNAMELRGEEVGVAAICIGGGEALALAVERQ